MSDAIVLDATPLGILCHPRNPPHVAVARRWLADLIAGGRRILVAEISDYEIRRELVRLGSKNGLRNLDKLGFQLEYLSLTTAIMRQAAALWAQARRTGQPTASDPALDGDMILAAQAMSLNTPHVVATANPAHLARFVPAKLWSSITP